MKNRSVVIALSLALSTPSLWSATLTWDIQPGTLGAGDSIITGGSGTWDTTLANWTTDGGANNLAWDNSSLHTAVISGASGTVTLGADIEATSLTISTASTVATSGWWLYLHGTGTAINASASATISGSGKIFVKNNQSWSNSSGSLLVSCPVDTGANLLTLNTGNNNIDVTGKISGTGGLTVNSTGGATSVSASGNATLNNANDYTGTTKVSGGYFWLNSGGLEALGADTSDIEISSGGFRLQGTGTISRGLAITGNCGISKISGDTTITGKISGTGSFTASANFAVAARVIFSSMNEHTGATLVGPDGILRLAHVDAVKNSTLRWADNNGRSVFDLSNANLAYNIGGLGSATLNNTSNNLNLGSATAAGGSGLVSVGGNNQSNLYVGILSGTAGLRKVGSGTQTMYGTNAYTGNTVIANGTLKLGKLAGQSNVSVTTGTTGTNVNRLTVPSSTNLYIGQSVTGTLIPTGARITNINSGTQVTLSTAPTSANTATTVSFLDFDGSVTTSPVIEVQSTGILDVTAYPWTLQSTQTLGGTGTVSGAASIEGIISPALASTGTLTTGNLSFASTGSYECTLDGTNADTLAAGTLSVTTGAKVAFTGTPTAPSYVIATYTGAAPAPFATDASLPAGYSLDYSESGKIKLVSGGAPEIAVEQPLLTDIPNNGTKSFGSVLVGQDTSLVFTIKNTGTAALEGLTHVMSGSGDFTLTASPVAPVTGPGGTTTFTIRFAPTSAGPKNASISFVTNDNDENPFVILLSGTGTTPYLNWAGDKGLTAENRAPNLDPDKDGANNLLEFALGGEPTISGNSGVTSLATQTIGLDSVMTYTIATRAGTTFAAGPNNSLIATRDGVSYRVEAGTDLITWNQAVSEVTPAMPGALPVNPPSGYEYHTFRTNGAIGSAEKIFLRVHVSE